MSKINIHSYVVSDLINQYTNLGTGAEIGVYRAETSSCILKNTNVKLLYMIDQYQPNYDVNQETYKTKNNSTEYLNPSKGDPDKDYKIVKNKFVTKYPNRYKLIRESSKNASQKINTELDFIFIDANHTYEYVLEDMYLWIPKVKSGGLIMGHDWWSKFPGVEKAVTEYASIHSFYLPDNPSPKLKLIKKIEYCLAPTKNPCVLKSWPEGHVWWGIKK